MAERKAFPLRLDPSLHDAITREAARQLRSTNAEIEMLLREALKARGHRLPEARPPRRGRPPSSD
jgi:hypothetical protein